MSGRGRRGGCEGGGTHGAISIFDIDILRPPQVEEACGERRSTGTRTRGYACDVRGVSTFGGARAYLARRTHTRLGSAEFPSQGRSSMKIGPTCLLMVNRSGVLDAPRPHARAQEGGRGRRRGRRTGAGFGVGVGGTGGTRSAPLWRRVTARRGAGRGEGRIWKPGRALRGIGRGQAQARGTRLRTQDAGRRVQTQGAG